MLIAAIISKFRMRIWETIQNTFVQREAKAKVDVGFSTSPAFKLVSQKKFYNLLKPYTIQPHPSADDFTIKSHSEEKEQVIKQL